MRPAPLSPTRSALRFREIAFSFEPPVPGFECRFLYQVLRALAVIFRQRWEGFQILASIPKPGQAIKTRKKRGPNGCGHRPAAGWACYFARGLAWIFINQSRSLGWIHGLDRYLRRLTIGAFAGTRNPPSLLRNARSANGHSDHNFECILLCCALATAGRTD